MMPLADRPHLEHWLNWRAEQSRPRVGSTKMFVHSLKARRPTRQHRRQHSVSGLREAEVEGGALEDASPYQFLAQQTCQRQVVNSIILRQRKSRPPISVDTPSFRDVPNAFVFWMASSRFSLSRVAIAAASDRHSPPKVPEKNMSSTLLMISRRPTNAEIGMPLPSALPKAAKSGTTP
jgi:hypothetical protein